MPAPPVFGRLFGDILTAYRGKVHGPSRNTRFALITHQSPTGHCASALSSRPAAPPFRPADAALPARQAAFRPVKPLLCRECPFFAEAFAKSFFIAKILYEYTMNYLRQE
jgi:hypothetical protein